jgi:hypothetical protein
VVDTVELSKGSVLASVVDMKEIVKESGELDISPSFRV